MSGERVSYGGRGTFSFLRPLFKKKRAFERTARNTVVHLFSQGAFLGSGNLLDESEGGAKVTSGSSFVLEHATYLLNPAKATVHTLQLAWQRGREAGFRYTGVRNLRGFVDDPRIAHVVAYWATISPNHGVSAPRGVFGRHR